MVKIALLTEYKGLGGGESNIVAVAEELARQGHEVHLIGAGAVLSLVDPNLVSRFEFKFPQRSWWWGLPIPRFNLRLRKYLKNVNVVHAYSINTLPYLFWIRSPIVYTIHGPWEKIRALRGWVVNALVDRITFVSEDVRRGSYFFGGVSKVVYLGAKLPATGPTMAPRVDNVLRILCVGRFQSIKGQLFLIQALAEISNSFAELELTFAGGPSSGDPVDIDYMDSCISLAAEVSNKNFKINFIGHQNELIDCYSIANLVVVPSFYESFSMVTVESLLMGKVVVAPSVGGPLEILKDLDSAEFFIPGDKLSLQEAIRKAVSKDADVAFRLSQERGSRFTVERQASDYGEIYAGLLPRR